LLCPELSVEIDRIYATAASNGHPVHYVVLEDDPSAMERKLELLCGSLFSKGRLHSRRLMYIDLYQIPLRDETIRSAYKLQRGGTVVVNLKSCEASSEHATSIEMTMETIARFATEMRHSVLTIFTAAPEDTRLVRDAETLVPSMRFLELKSGEVSLADAKKFLVRLAAEKGCKGCTALLSELAPQKQSFCRKELTTLFYDWYDKRLREKVYPAYSFVDAAPVVIMNTAQTGTAYEALQSMIGLDCAKRVVGQAVDYAKAQRIYAAHGFASIRPSLHMAFTGNPGTAKTTVARLTAQIFHDNGLLPKGDLIEVGREDLVGKYVGWTAGIVDEKFARAKGSMLFIDEAYSLLDGEQENYGIEAVNAIVQHMENDRSDTVVVFAGYSEPMERFIRSNAGLRSRVAFHVDFPDYSEDELVAILKMMLDQRERTITPECETEARTVLRRAMRREGFGNGRFVRTMAEQAMLSQASRIVRLPVGQVTDENIRLLLPEDFRDSGSQNKSNMITIGFAS
jgi:AAA+ superfamily predicted ATPase